MVSLRLLAYAAVRFGHPKPFASGFPLAGIQDRGSRGKKPYKNLIKS
jgi:hypothetical protein